jgi:hypothetical protein
MATSNVLVFEHHKRWEDAGSQLEPHSSLKNARIFRGHAGVSQSECIFRAPLRHRTWRRTRRKGGAAVAGSHIDAIPNPPLFVRNVLNILATPVATSRVSSANTRMATFARAFSSRSVDASKASAPAGSRVARKAASDASEARNTRQTVPADSAAKGKLGTTSGRTAAMTRWSA